MELEGWGEQLQAVLPEGSLEAPPERADPGSWPREGQGTRFFSDRDVGPDCGSPQLRWV